MLKIQHFLFLDLLERFTTSAFKFCFGGGNSVQIPLTYLYDDWIWNRLAISSIFIYSAHRAILYKTFAKDVYSISSSDAKPRFLNFFSNFNKLIIYR